jgi:predicted transcriptional regulator
MKMTEKGKIKRIPLQKTIWCKVRYWQNLNDISDHELADYLGCTERTLHNYDADPSCITLKTIDRFLIIIDMSLTDFLVAA